MTSNREDGFWRRLRARLGSPRAADLSLDDAERRLEQAEDEPVDPETIESIIRSVTSAESPVGDEANADDYEPVVFARSYGVSRAFSVLIGILLLMSAGFVTVSSLWPESRKNTQTLPFAHAIYLYCDQAETPARRQSAQTRAFKFTLEGIRVVQALRYDEQFGPAAVGYLESFAAALDDPDSIRAQPIEEPFRDLARFLLDRVNESAGRRDALDEIASQTLTGIGTLLATSPPNESAAKGAREIARRLRTQLDQR